MIHPVSGPLEDERQMQCEGYLEADFKQYCRTHMVNPDAVGMHESDDEESGEEPHQGSEGSGGGASSVEV